MPDNIVTLDPRPQDEAFAPTYTVAPGCLISGTPNERGVTQFTSEDGTVNAGVWTCDTYRERIPSYPCDELFVVIEGSVTLTEEGRDPRSYGPGDAFVIRRGTVCEFEATGPLRKFYMTCEPELARGDR